MRTNVPAARAIASLLSLIVTVGIAHADVMGSAPITGNEGTFGGATVGTVDSATGTATASYSFELPPGRGGVGPALGLHYVHTRGPEIAGQGWSLGLPSIDLRGVAGGPPRFDGSDHYELSGAPLTEICVVSSAPSLSDDCRSDMNPSWANGWVLYRFQVERVSTKVFRPAGSDTWRVLHVSGAYIELGVPSQTIDRRALDVHRSPGDGATETTVRWNIVGQYDSQAGTRNVARYVWKHVLLGEHRDRGRLEDIYYTAPTTGSLTSTDEYAHHIHLDYDVRQIPLQVYPPMALRLPDSRLRRVAVASRGPNANAPRERVRVYELTYHTEHMIMRGRPYLASIKQYGRCASTISEQQIGNDRDIWQLPQDNTSCAELPPTTFEYTEEAHFRDYAPIQDGAFVGGSLQQELRLPWNCGSQTGGLLSADNVALVDVDRNGLPDIVQSGGIANNIFLNRPSNFFFNSKFLECAILSDGDDSSFAPTDGLTVFGPWIDEWAPSFLRRRGGSVSYDDGFPDEVQRIVSDTPWKGAPHWAIETANWPNQVLPTLSGKLPPPHLLGDLNNDGLIDAIYLVTSATNSPIETKVALSVRQANGTVAAFSKIVASNLFLGVGSVGPSAWPAPRYAALADMNGDGLLDYVTTHDPAASSGEFIYLPGRGDGTFGCDDDIPGHGCVPATAPPGKHPTNGTALKVVHIQGYPGLPTLPKLGLNKTWDNFFHDVNGDGRADLVSFISDTSGVGLDVFLNLDGRTFRHARLDFFPDKPQFAQPVRRLLFADMNGNGVDDIVLVSNVSHPSDSKAYFFDLEHIFASSGRGGTAIGSRGGPTPGLLRRINHSGGATTEYSYETIATIEDDELFGSSTWPADPKDPDTGTWRYHSPMPLQVVTRITTVSNAPDPYNNWSQTEFSYRDPVFDTWRARFRGFRRVRTTVDLDSVDTKYFFGGCLAPDGWETFFESSPQSRSCIAPEFDKWEALQGLPIQVEHLSPNKYASTTRFSYRLDDRSIAVTAPQLFTYVDEVNTFLYDREPFTPSPQHLPINLATYSPSPNLAPLNIANVPPTLTPTLDTALLRADAVRLRQRLSHDQNRNLVDAWDDGRVALASGAAVDRPILHHTDWQFVSGPGVYRPEKQRTTYDGTGQVVPLVPDGPAREVFLEYDSAGRLTKVKAPLSGALPLDRWHETGQAIAPEPPDAAANGVTHTLLTIVYDQYGNVTESQGADGQCERTDYLSPYLDLPLSHTTFLNGCGAAQDALVTRVDYDRGLGALTTVTGPSLSRTTFKHDLLGRIVRVEGPDPATPLATLPEAEFEYEPSAAGPVHWVKVTRKSTDAGDQVSWIYSSSLGHPLATLTQADPAAGDGGAWIAHPGPNFDQQGRPTVTFEPEFYNGLPGAYLTYKTSKSEALSAWYELGRLRGVVRRGDTVLRRDYHALSVDIWDAENLEAGSPHAGAITRLESDGHGRLIHTTKEGNAPAEARFDYLPTGELVALERRFTEFGPLQFQSAIDRKYMRWRRFDSLGRVVENAEPNTASGFTENPADPAAANMRSWRYAYDRSGRLVGTRDARGCGKNLFYDRADRLLYEDYSPCLATHEPYTTPNPVTGDGTELFNTYDAKQLSQQPYGQASKGRLVAVQDRGSELRLAFDARGRPIAATRRMAKPGPASPLLANRYTNHPYAIHAEFDGFDRVRRQSTGADAPELLETGVSEIRPHYSARGLVTKIDSSYGPLVTDIRADADSFVRQMRYGDIAGTLAEMTPDDRRRLEAHNLSRSTAGPWASGGSYTPPSDGSTLQAELVNQRFHYDLVSNIIKIDDLRNPQLWPVGSKPASLTSIERDAQYRVTQTVASHGNDAFVSPFSAEISAGSNLPVPQLALPFRTGTLRYSYDGFGNLLGQSELPQAIYDRGLSNVTIGHATDKPNQLVEASSGAGDVQSFYDAAGNLVALDLERNAQCLGPSQKCSQRFLYEWDEVNQLSGVRRWDYTSLLGMPRYPSQPAGTSAAESSYIYSNGERIIKSVHSAGTDSHVVDVFGSLRLGQTTYNAATNDYDRSGDRQHVYLAGVGKAVHAPGLPSTGSDRHVFLLVSDHLGSPSVVIDKDTSEVVEYRGYLPYGATDYDYRPTRWHSFREDLHFTGKEEDVETGLIYFGARHYSPNLQSFISADPLTIHGWRGDANPYAYVGGQVIDRIDPFGLCAGSIGFEKCPSSDGGIGPDGVGGSFNPLDLFPDDQGGGRGSAYGGGGPTAPYVPPPLLQPAPPGSYNTGVVSQAATAHPFDPGADMNWLDRWIWGGTGAFHDAVTSSSNLSMAQDVAAGISIGAATIATGGLALEVVGAAGLTAEGLGAAVLANSGRAALAFTELSLAEQGIVVGGGGAGVLLGERAVETIDPSAVRFTQDSIGATFRNGQSINDVANVLRGPEGANLAKEFPAIRLVEKDGLLFTLDNRRLAAFSAGGQQVPYRMATPAEIAKEWGAKFTTTVEQGWGKYISVRPRRK